MVTVEVAEEEPTGHLNKPGKKLEKKIAGVTSSLPGFSANYPFVLARYA